MTTGFKKLSDEFDGIAAKPAVQKKTVEQFRAEIVDSLLNSIKKETEKSVDFIKVADYLNAKVTEAKIEGLHTALGVIIDASTISVKEI